MRQRPKHTKIRVAIGLVTITYIPSRHTRLGIKRGAGYGSCGIPGIGVFTYIKRMPVTGYRVSLKVVR